MTHAGGVECVSGRQTLAALALSAVVAVKQLLACDDLAKIALGRGWCLCLPARVQVVGWPSAFEPDPRKTFGIPAFSLGSSWALPSRELGSDRSFNGGGGPDSNVVRLGSRRLNDGGLG